MGFFKNCDYHVPFVVIATDPLLKGSIWCGEYEEFLTEPSYDRFEEEWKDPRIVRGITWNNVHFSPILSRERHCKLPPMGNNYYEDTDEYKALRKLQDEFRENNYGRVTRYLFGDETTHNQQSPAHWFLNFNIWVIGRNYYERPFAKNKWGNFK